ncbi:DUF1531-domain-containing protein [Dipodascopsis uninucleata]
MAIHIFDSLKEYSIRDYYPIFIIVCGYILFRPYLIKIGAQLQKRDHRRTHEAEKQKLAAEALNAQPKVDEQYVEETNNEVWGRNARLRQKVAIKKIEQALERKSEMEKEDESDKEIEEFLEK